MAIAFIVFLMPVGALAGAKLFDLANGIGAKPKVVDGCVSLPDDIMRQIEGAKP